MLKNDADLFYIQKWSRKDEETPQLSYVLWSPSIFNLIIILIIFTANKFHSFSGLPKFTFGIQYLSKGFSPLMM